jgi:ATP-dependent helicase/nuclease subunit A
VRTKILNDIDENYLVENPRHLVTIEGCVDCILKTKKGLVIIDYKTNCIDNVDDFIEKYRSQLWLYKIALEELFKKNVYKLLIYSLYLNKFITIFSST